MEILDRKQSLKTALDILLSAALFAAWMQEAMGEIYANIRTVMEVPGNTSYCRFHIDMSLIYGLPHVDEIFVPITNQVWIDIDKRSSPYRGSHLLMYGFEPTTATLFYWYTKMISIYPNDKGMHHVTSTANQLSRAGLLNAPRGGGTGITISCN